MKSSFLLYADAYDSIRLLEPELKGQLLDAIFMYQRGEELPTLAPVVEMAFSFIRSSFERDNSKYAKRCEKATEAARVRWDKKNADACERISEYANDADSDSDSVSDSALDKKKSNTPLAPRRGECSYSASFEEFWSTYPLRKGKAAAYRAWKSVEKKHPGVKPPQIITAVKAQVEADTFRSPHDGQLYIPHPATWLNAGRWDDDVSPPGKSGDQTAGMTLAQKLELARAQQ